MTDRTEQQALPSSWRIESLAHIGIWRGGGTPSKAILSFWDNGTIPWVSPKDMKISRIRTAEDKITESALNSSATNLIESGAVLVVTRSGILKHSLPVAVSEVDVALNQDLKAISPYEGIDPYYLSFAFECFEQDILHHCTKSGTTVQSIEFPRLIKYKFPIAPTNEQRRIVAKIEELFTKLDAGVASLKAAKAQIKRYRQSVLKAAVEGELTRKWREQHKDELEPASVLLERTLRERRKKWEADQLAKMQAQGKTPNDDKWKAKYEEPAAPDVTNLPDLPEEWIWTTPEALSTFDSNSICAGPFGTIFKAKDFRPSGIPIIFLRHVSPGRYLTHKPGFMDIEVWRNLFQSYSVYGGELLVTKLGEPPGVCAIYPNGIGPAMVTPDVIKMSVNEAVTLPRFLMNYFNSEIARRYTFGIAFGTTRLRMTIPIFREMPVPLPPFAEQQQIVAEVERRLSVADEIDASLDAELKRAERLRQSILKRAFEGKLVPQDPNDEPASVLLERIKAQRAKLEGEVEPKKSRRVKESGNGNLFS